MHECKVLGNEMHWGSDFTGGSAGGLFCGSIPTIVWSSYSEREKQWVGFRQLVPAVKFFKDGKDLSIGNRVRNPEAMTVIAEGQSIDRGKQVSMGGSG